MLILCQLTRNILSGRSVFKRSGNCCSTAREHPCNCFPPRIDIRLQMVSMFLWYRTIHSFNGLTLVLLTLKSSCAMLLLGIASSWTWIKNPKQRPSLRCHCRLRQETLKTGQRISHLICPFLSNATNKKVKGLKKGMKKLTIYFSFSWLQKQTAVNLLHSAAKCCLVANCTNQNNLAVCCTQFFR